MQLLPATADYIANLSGGTAFEQGDLATPQINIAYGSFYLKYLMEKYRGSEVLSLAAYNAGEGKVDEWLGGAAANGETFQVAKHIPFPETRDYVETVLDARARVPPPVRARARPLTASSLVARRRALPALPALVRGLDGQRPRRPAGHHRPARPPAWLGVTASG